MQWLTNKVRREILTLKAYTSARSELANTDNLLALDANENPWEPYPQSNIHKRLNRYPQPQPVELLQRLANLYGVSSNEIFVGRGMDEAIELLIRVFCTPYQDNIVSFKPSFSYYSVAAKIAGIAIRELNLANAPKFTLDLDQLLNLCDNNTKIIFLCTPNNPTGTVLTLDEIKYILKQRPETIIAIDEAYQEFSDIPSACDLMAKHTNLVVLKTMSKAFAFAGVRLGSLLAHQQIIQLINKVMAPYPLATPCIDLALATLSAHGLFLAQERIELIKSERARVYQQLTTLKSIQVYSSAANFLLISVADANKTYQELLARGIVVRNRHSDIPNTLRISIGTVEENNLLLAALGINDIKLAKMRVATVIRNTNETKIIAYVNLDNSETIKINTGIGFFDHMLEQLAKHGKFSLNLQVSGDTHIDFHHSVEDSAIALAQAINQALGDKRGINRYAYTLPMDEALASVAIDLSGRGLLVYQANFPCSLIGNFPVEMLEHFFTSFANNLNATIHLQVSGKNAHHMAEALFKALAKALNQAMTVSDNSLPSTKGVL